MKKYIHSNADFMCLNFIWMSNKENTDKTMIVLLQVEWKPANVTVTNVLSGQIS